MLRAWTRTLLVVLVGVAIASALMREGIAGLVGVREEPWAAAASADRRAVAAALPPARRPAGHRRVRAGRLVGRVRGGRPARRRMPARVRAGVVGACLGTPLAMAATPVALAQVVRRRARRPRSDRQGARAQLRTLVVAGWAPIVGLLLLAALQNIDVIMAKRGLAPRRPAPTPRRRWRRSRSCGSRSGSGCTCSPKRRGGAGGLDPRPVLLRALGPLAIAVPSLMIFAGRARPAAALAFGAGRDAAADALPFLGLAMTLLAVATWPCSTWSRSARRASCGCSAVVAIAEPMLLSATHLRCGLRRDRVRGPVRGGGVGARARPRARRGRVAEAT